MGQTSSSPVSTLLPEGFHHHHNLLNHHHHHSAHLQHLVKHLPPVTDGFGPLLKAQEILSYLSDSNAGAAPAETSGGFPGESSVAILLPLLHLFASRLVAASSGAQEGGQGRHAKSCSNGAAKGADFGGSGKQETLRFVSVSDVPLHFSSSSDSSPMSLDGSSNEAMPNLVFAGFGTANGFSPATNGASSWEPSFAKLLQQKIRRGAFKEGQFGEEEYSCFAGVLGGLCPTEESFGSADGIQEALVLGLAFWLEFWKQSGSRAAEIYKEKVPKRSSTRARGKGSAKANDCNHSAEKKAADGTLEGIDVGPNGRSGGAAWGGADKLLDSRLAPAESGEEAALATQALGSGSRESVFLSLVTSNYDLEGTRSTQETVHGYDLRESHLLSLVTSNYDLSVEEEEEEEEEEAESRKGEQWEADGYGHGSGEGWKEGMRRGGMQGDGVYYRGHGPGNAGPDPSSTAIGNLMSTFSFQSLASSLQKTFSSPSLGGSSDSNASEIQSNRSDCSDFGPLRWHSATSLASLSFQQQLLADMLQDCVSGSSSRGGGGGDQLEALNVADVARVLGLAASVADRQPVTAAVCMLRLLDRLGVQGRVFLGEGDVEAVLMSDEGRLDDGLFGMLECDIDGGDDGASWEGGSDGGGRGRGVRGYGSDDGDDDEEGGKHGRRGNGGMSSFLFGKTLRQFVVLCILDILQKYAPQALPSRIPEQQKYSGRRSSARRHRGHVFGAGSELPSHAAAVTTDEDDDLGDDVVLPSPAVFSSSLWRPYRLSELAEIRLVESTSAVCGSGITAVECAHLDRLHVEHVGRPLAQSVGPGVLALAMAVEMDSLSFLWPEDISDLAEGMLEIGCNEAAYRLQVRAIASPFAEERDFDAAVRSSLLMKGHESVPSRIQRLIQAGETAMARAPTANSRAAYARAFCSALIRPLISAQSIYGSGSPRRGARGDGYPWAQEVAASYLRFSTEVLAADKSDVAENELKADMCAEILLKGLLRGMEKDEKEEGLLLLVEALSEPKQVLDWMHWRAVGELLQRRNATHVALPSLQAKAVTWTYQELTDEGTAIDSSALLLFDWGLESILVDLNRRHPSTLPCASPISKQKHTPSKSTSHFGNQGYPSAPPTPTSAPPTPTPSTPRTPSTPAGSVSDAWDDVKHLVQALSPAPGTAVDVLLAVAVRLTNTIYWCWPRRREAPRFVARILSHAHGEVGMDNYQLERALKIGKRVWGWTMPSPNRLKSRCESEEEAHEIVAEAIIAAWYSFSSWEEEGPIHLVGEHWPHN